LPSSPSPPPTLAASSRIPHLTSLPRVLRDAATVYKVDLDAISLKVKHEFAAKEKAKLAPKPAAKATPPKARKAA
jgi:hypothetical protein